MTSRVKGHGDEVQETAKLVGDSLPTPRTITRTVSRSKGQRSRLPGRLLLRPKVYHSLSTELQNWWSMRLCYPLRRPAIVAVTLRIVNSVAFRIRNDWQHTTTITGYTGNCLPSSKLSRERNYRIFVQYRESWLISVNSLSLFMSVLLKFTFSLQAKNSPVPQVHLTVDCWYPHCFHGHWKWDCGFLMFCCFFFVDFFNFFLSALRTLVGRSTTH